MNPRRPAGRVPVAERRGTSLLGAVAVAALLVAACQPAGIDGGRALPSTSAPSAPSGRSPTAGGVAAEGSLPPTREVDPRADGLDVRFGEFAITLEAPAIRPGPVTFVVHNAGQMTHGFEMKIEGGDGSDDGDRMKIETRTFRSGETLRVEADLPAGTYEIECFIADHEARGMRSTLLVRADAPLMRVDPASPPPGTIRIVQFAFVAADTDVTAGTPIVWTNQDPTPHTVTANAGAFDSRQLEPGGAFSTTLQRPGDYLYRCEIHPTMTGTVHVR